MARLSIPDSTARLNAYWIREVESFLAGQGDPNIALAAMRAGSKGCLRRFEAEFSRILGRPPETVDELVLTAGRRRRRGLGAWEKRGDEVWITVGACGCPLVMAGLVEPNAVHCLCSRGLLESLFSGLDRGRAQVEIVKAIGRGDEGCELRVTFER